MVLSIILSALKDFFLAENIIFKKLKTFFKKNPTAKRINIVKIAAFINHSLGVFCSGRCNNINLKETKWTEINIDNPILNSQNKINKPELIFRKIEDEEIENQIEKLKS